MRGSVDFDFFLEKNKTFKQNKYTKKRHTMGYLWTKYLKLRFLGRVPLVTRSVEKVALNKPIFLILHCLRYVNVQIILKS